MVLARSSSWARQAYSGRSWCSDGMLRAKPVRSRPEWSQAVVGAVDELVEGAGRAAVRGAQRDELAGDLGAAAFLDVPAGDQPAHGVADEHDLCVGVRPALVPPSLQGGLDDRAEPRPLYRQDSRQS